MIPGNTSSQGKKPTTPTIGTATASAAAATVTFTESTYKGKTSSGTYKAIAFTGGIQTNPVRSGTCNAPCNSITVSSLANGTAYTFKVQLETPYGVNSDLSTSSNSATPVSAPQPAPVASPTPVAPQPAAPVAPQPAAPVAPQPAVPQPAAPVATGTSCSQNGPCIQTEIGNCVGVNICSN